MLFEGDAAALQVLNAALAQEPGPIRPLLALRDGGLYPAELLMTERATSTNTAAAGGNASLMSL
ncbi:hypothetical protein BKE38_05355 [Pseudoroseomonas deserti]|uniref:Uncharacterized protein n=1 Tax=Teichococcus deserti TaxID=1817963 RepID=A0A1V2H6A3_9PROT|nr:hypothetical protein [Pseudoroseomonas deserti]ONG56751.1 hypothetical protein BKE38_05355 [Pseudoroseomonas deserti]